MSNLAKGNTLASDIELTSINVEGSENRIVDSWWEHNVSEQFPIKSVKEENGIACIEVDKPHEGCTIRTRLKNSKMDGESKIFTKKNILMASLTFVEGIACGPCTIYKNGFVFFRGNFENGYREGRGQEYDRDGEIISDGFYSKGNKLNIERSKEMGKEDYWKEYDENGKLIRICQKDKDGNNEGYCYYYDNEGKKLDRLSHFENGVESLYSGKFKLYDEPAKLWFEGNFENGYREGRGQEYDRNGKVISDGFYSKGNKLNIERLEEMGKDYWKEYDENGKLIRICQKDDYGNNEGYCYYYDNEGKNLDRLSHFENGIESLYSGKFKLYDEPTKLWFEGIFENGYREGRGQEFDRNGKMISDGFYSKGNKLKIERLEEMGKEEYWKEYDENGKLIRICQKDKDGNNDGMCYYYDNEGKNLDRLSHFENGVESLYSGKFKLYDEPAKLWFEGNFENGYREGRGQEYDRNGKVISDGFYSKGNKLNIERLEEMGKDYWKEYDENGKLIRICQKDDYGNNEGYCYYYDNEGKNLDRLSHFENGIESLYSGKFKLYDEPTKLWFEGIFENGYREGRGQEFDRNGKMISDGFYSKGNKLKIERSKEMGKDYWKEYDENGKLIRICQKDKAGNNDGMCYSYSADKISRISLWKEGKEVTLLKQFSSNIMTEYKNGHKVYEGGFLNDIRKHYPRNGEGEEYDEDGESVIFQGRYVKGKRHGKGIEYDNGVAKQEREWVMGRGKKEMWIIQSIMMILVIVLLVVSFKVQVAIGSIILGVLLLFFSSLWKCQEWLIERVCVFFDFDDSIASIIDRFLKDDKKSKTCKSKFKKVMRSILNNFYLYMIVIMVIVIIIFIVYSIIDYYYGGPHGIGYFQKSYIVQNGYGNQFKRFTISNYPNLKTIEIGDDCFGKTTTFVIDGLKSLETIKIGSNSFSNAATMQLSNLNSLESIEIGNDYFGSVKTFQIDGLNRLKTIKIGKNSFTQYKNDWGDNKSKSFHILNCESLESIQIGEYSFSDFAGEFELKNLPQLQSIQIGECYCRSYNFYYSSFVIRGIEMMLNIVMIRSSKSTIHYIR